MSQYQTELQNECLNKMWQNTVGQIILPTGAGKSRIEFEYAKERMVAGNDIHEIVIIVAPRIILCQQLIEEFYKYQHNKYGKDSNQVFTFVSSGNIPSIKIGGVKILGKNIGKHTTDVAEIEKRLDDTRALKKDSIIFSTYASFSACIEAIKKYSAKHDRNTIKVSLLADEAHHFAIGDEVGCSKESAFKVLKNNLNLFDSRFFLTATPKVSGVSGDDHSGMDNEKIYGTVIFEKQPKELIKNAVICMPVVQRVIPEKEITEDKFREYAGDTILQGFKEHEKLINEHCGVEDLNGKLGAKVLVAVDGGDQFRALKRGLPTKAHALGIVVAGTMSDNQNHTQQTFITDAEGKPKTYEMDDFLAEIRKLGANDEQKMIVLHYNQLTEGIDIPAMTGLMPLRDMEQKNIVQNLGRISRLHPLDKGKSYDDVKGWLKPYAYVILPEIEGMNAEFGELIAKIRDDYDPDIRIINHETAKGGMVVETKDVLGNKVVPCDLKYSIEDFEAELAKIMSGGKTDLNFLKEANGSGISQ